MVSKLQGDFRTDKRLNMRKIIALHRQPLQEGQDLVAAGEAQLEAVPGNIPPHYVPSTDLPLSQILVDLDDSCRVQHE
jgi:hypothetical protein